MTGTTAKVTGISPKATEKDLREFFSFSGVIQSIELKREEDQTAYITFKTLEGLNTAVLLTGAVIVDSPVNISPAGDDYVPPPAPAESVPAVASTESNLNQDNRVQNIVAGLLAHGYILGKGAVERAKNFDQKHKISATAQEKALAMNTKLGLTTRVSAASSVVGTQVKAVDEKYNISETTKTMLHTAEQKVNDAAAAVMKNKHVAAGATWMSESFKYVSKAAEDVTNKAIEKVNAKKSGSPGSDNVGAGGPTEGVSKLNLDEPSPAGGHVDFNRDSSPAVLHTVGH
eukprot:TRINITY_DN17274_c0_g1_i1.p1 TRINITY_DN17274_c0_g1~~TRINITY_DN17274_c0_g1_i1.p1  ORF type:complete len:287 (-),score=70.98 TRINITY_DN17274_c0_g1_i1:1040-1900(-)